MTNAAVQLGGVYVPLVTPFDSDGSVAAVRAGLDAIQRLARCAETVV
ncbi:hypothetical protein HC028_14380 [Planosporangium flavigriseum]|nr:hypothetical protein [Planosporangium flavigriseum]NJC65676.1 hypothetical protein [Planosporangium flavigriseum]